MKKFHLLMFVLASALAVVSMVSCQALAELDPNLVADLVTAAVTPALEKLDGVSVEQSAAIAEAIRSGVAAGMPQPDGSFDINTVLPHAATAIATYFGVNLRRDQRRGLRGEPTANANITAV